jgi:hypothetical protein
MQLGLLILVLVALYYLASRFGNGSGSEGRGGPSTFLRDHPYQLRAGYVACTSEEDLKRVNSLRHNIDALTRFMIGNPTCFFTSSDSGSAVYFEGYAGTGYIRFHASGRPMLLYTYEGALR